MNKKFDQWIGSLSFSFIVIYNFCLAQKHFRKNLYVKCSILHVAIMHITHAVYVIYTI